jgi:hypothetical protein
MFQLLPGRPVLPLTADAVVAVIESINTPQVSIPDAGSEPAKTFLVSCLVPSGNICLFWYLLYLETNRPLLYVAEVGEMAIQSYPQVESNAISFVEGMGFMLDNLHFRNRPPAEQISMLQAFPFAREQLQRTPSAVRAGAVGALSSIDGLDERSTQRQSLLRLLSAF